MRKPAKNPNVKLRAGADPITVSGFAYGGGGVKLAFPTEDRQRAGWCAKNDAKKIVRDYPDRYELINGGECKCLEAIA